MAKYLLSYDFHKARDYRRLYELLNKWGAKRLLESLWLANLNGSADAVAKALIATGDNDDTFAVIELKKDLDWAVSETAQKPGIDWLKANL